MVYYHVSRQRKIGDVISPQTKPFGIWSRFAYTTMIKSYADFAKTHDYLKASSVFKETGRTFAKWLCETLFESIRQQGYPNCPTRIYGTFLCKELNESRIFNNAERDGNGTIFLVHTKAPVDYFDMHLFTDAECSLYNGINEEVYNYCLEKVVKYWESKNDASVSQKEYICMEDLLLSEIVS